MNAPRSISLPLMVQAVVFSALVLAWPCAWSAPAAEPAAPAASAVAAAHAEERASIAKERAATEARYRSREQACRQHFIVTSCIDEAKAERRQAIDRQRARQLIVDEARRHERAEQRRAELAEKSAEDALRERAHSARAPASGASAPTGTPFEKGRARATANSASATHATHGARPSATGIDLKPRPQESKVVREQREASSRTAFEVRQAEAAEHRDEAIERTTKRMAKKSPAAQLPSPGAASAAAASLPRP